MYLWMKKLLSPPYLFRFSVSLRPWVLGIFLVALAYGIMGALLLSPPDYQQGNVYRIMYIHVPLAIWSLGAYTVMTASSLLFLVWHHKVVDMIAKVCAPIGAVMTALTLITGAIWGKPTWGTWWIWDARLTTEMVLLFIYFGIISVRVAIPNNRLAARVVSVVTLLGFVDIPLVHYSVTWWHTLHQGPSILAWQHPLIASSMLYPLLSMIAAVGLYFLLTLMLGLEREILKREKETRWVEKLVYTHSTSR